MCGGVTYEHNGEIVRTYFPNPYAKLPVLRRSGADELLSWGRRKGEPGRLPLGGWARLESIHSGRWDRWQPQPVRLHVSSFMEKDIHAVSHWFDLTRGQWIQGLVAREADEMRVYVVTIVPEMDDAVHERWPRIVTR
jgi:hypothetical protein